MQVRLHPLLQDSVEPVVASAVTAGFIPALFSADATLWGPEAQPEASIRLGWVVNPAGALHLVEDITELRARLAAQGVTRVILCGMGGSSLGPEVMARAYGVELTIVDTVHPDVLAPLISADLSDAVVVVSSKSGGTVETDSLRRIWESAFVAHNIEPRDRIVVVTDPGSPLAQEAEAAGHQLFLGDAHIGGRFSVLSAFGLVPAGLAGVPLGEVLASAERAWQELSRNSVENAGLRLGAAIAAGAPQRNKLLLGETTACPGFGNWVEQLVAESTGKNGLGVLPVVGSHLGHASDTLSVGEIDSGSDVELSGDLGALFFLWALATAFAGYVTGVNPFDQPDVERAKIAARALLGDSSGPKSQDMELEGGVAWSAPAFPHQLHSVGEVARWMMSLATERSYIALCVFGPGGQDEGPWRAVAAALETTTQRPVTLGFGPRFLHSTGQFHKGGPAEGIFLQLLETPAHTLEIPGREFDCESLLMAQAHGDAAVLAQTGQPVATLTLRTLEERDVFIADVVGES